MRHPSVAVALVGSVALAVAVGVAPADAATHHTWNVGPGTGTISAAVAAASPGDTIQLEVGTYRDSVVIAKTLTIRGAGESKTVIKPPKHPKMGFCNSPGSVEGLCIVGGVDSQGNASGPPVVGVSITDLRVTGFSDSGIIGLNTKGLFVHDVRSDHNGGYGIARFQSTRSLFSDNWAADNGEAGLYMGDSPHADSVLLDNFATQNGYGLFMRDSTDLTAVGNQVWDNCVGILALNSGSGAPGDLPAGNYVIVANTVWDNDRACPASGGPPTSGIGIGLAGVHNTVVSGNVVNANHPSGPSIISGGIAMLSTKFAGGANPTNNSIQGNTLQGNKPADIVSDGSGSGNTIRHNTCSTSIPAHRGFCS
jgi:nitrous oxidase accessory protein NosD